MVADCRWKRERENVLFCDEQGPIFPGSQIEKLLKSISFHLSVFTNGRNQSCGRDLERKILTWNSFNCRKFMNKKKFNQ